MIALPVSFSSAKTLAEVTESYEKKVTEILAEKSAANTKLREGYLRRLTLVKKDIQGSGNLEKAELIVFEIQKIQSDIWPLNPLTVTAPAILKKARKLYTEARFKIENKSAVSMVKLADIMLVFLEKRKIEATKSGELGEAQAARALLERLDKDEVISAARILAKQSDIGSRELPALRIRRYGDDIEVIVFYDANGKISFKSPVENTIEETNGKKEKGETSARTLGEFVGAKGYSGSSYTSLDQSFSKKINSANVSLSDFTQNPGYKVSGQIGLQLTLVNNPKNPYYAIKNVFPPVSFPGTYQVTCSYYVPAENRNLNGFALYQGGAVKIGAHDFSVKNKWVSKTVEGTSHNEETILRLYPLLRKGQSLASASGESIVLNHLTIKQIRFSAFIHTRYNQDGESLDHFAKASDQKLFISNGKILFN